MVHDLEDGWVDTPILRAHDNGGGPIKIDPIDILFGFFRGSDHGYPGGLQIIDGILEMIHLGNGDPECGPCRGLDGILGNGGGARFGDDDTMDPTTFCRSDDGPEVPDIG